MLIQCYGSCQVISSKIALNYSPKLKYRPYSQLPHNLLPVLFKYPLVLTCSQLYLQAGSASPLPTASKSITGVLLWHHIV